MASISGDEIASGKSEAKERATLQDLLESTPNSVDLYPSFLSVVRENNYPIPIPPFLEIT